MYTTIFFLLIFINYSFANLCRQNIYDIDIKEYKKITLQKHKTKEFENLIKIHKEKYKKIHNNIQFLYFHNKYLEEYEKIINFKVPYINWEDDYKNISNSQIFSLIYFKRNITLITGYSSFYIEKILNISDFNKFSSILEVGPHGLIHTSIQGYMQTEISPVDPLFWLHHSYIDLILNKWINKYKNIPNIRIEHYNTNIINKNCYNYSTKKLNINVSLKPSLTKNSKMFTLKQYNDLNNFLFSSCKKIDINKIYILILVLLTQI